MSPANIEDIMSRATDGIRELLKEAYEAGRAKGRDDIRRNLLSVLTNAEQPSDIAPRGGTPELDIAVQKALSRATSGTVKPTIKTLIENAEKGILTSEIIEKTGFKENSVRGTLSTLKAEGFADRRGDLWFRAKTEPPIEEEEGFADEEDSSFFAPEPS